MEIDKEKAVRGIGRIHHILTGDSVVRKVAKNNQDLIDAILYELSKCYE